MRRNFIDEFYHTLRNSRNSFSSLELADWWLRQQTGNPFPPELIPLFFEGGKINHSLSPLFQHIPTALEGSSQGITPELFSLLDEKEISQQKNHGIYYTPYPLAHLLAKEVLYTWLNIQCGSEKNIPPTDSSEALRLDKKLASLTVCDPAAGSGGLLVPFWLELAQLRLKLNSALQKGPLLLDILQNNLYAADLHPQAINTLRLRAALTLLAHGQSFSEQLLPHAWAGDALQGTPLSVWHTLFPNVFKRGGFDIILSNPPYLGQKNNKELFSTLRQNPRWSKKIAPKGDLLYLFFYLGLEITKPHGLMGFITTSYFAQAASGCNLRKTLQQQTICRRLLDFENQRLFKNAPGQHTLLSIFQMSAPSSELCRCGKSPQETYISQQRLYRGETALLQILPVSDSVQSILTKMADFSKRLEEIAVISNGLMSGCDKISTAHLKRFNLLGVQKGEGVFVLSSSEKDKLSLTPKEIKKLKPFFKNSAIHPYRTDKKPTHFLIDFFYPNDRKIDFSHYPNLMNHLARFKPVLLARKQNNNGIDKQLAQGKYWFGSVRRKMNFEVEKIVVPHRAKRNIFAYTPGAWYASSDVYFISQPKPPFSLWYLLALLNSTPYYLWLFYNGKRKGNLLELYSQPLGNLPVPLSKATTRQHLGHLAKEQYHLFSVNRQKQIDEMIIEIFNFSSEEKMIIYNLQKQLQKSWDNSCKK